MLLVDDNQVPALTNLQKQCKGTRINETPWIAGYRQLRMPLTVAPPKGAVLPHLWPIVFTVENLLADDVVDFCENLLEGFLHVCRLQGRRLDE